ncbi:hypothetical protein Trydic_g19644 [Trypoxylus dichotomus]
MTYIKVCLDFTKRFIDWRENTPFPFTDEDVSSLKTRQLIYTLQNIIAKKPQNVVKLEKFEVKFGLKSTNNTNIKCRWLRIGLQAHWEDKVKETVEIMRCTLRKILTTPIRRI